MSAEADKPLQYVPKKRVANIMAALFIVWTLALWTWVIHEIMENAITVGVDAEGQLQIALSPAMAIVTSILAMLNVALGVAMKHLWDSASHD